MFKFALCCIAMCHISVYGQWARFVFRLNLGVACRETIYPVLINYQAKIYLCIPWIICRVHSYKENESMLYRHIAHCNFTEQVKSLFSKYLALNSLGLKS